MPYKNKEEYKAYQKAYKQTHKEELRAYREDRKEEIAAYNKTWHQDHKEEKKDYYKENKEKRKLYLKENKEKINAKVRAYGKVWGKANPEKRRAAWARRRAKKAGVINLPIRPNFLAFLIEVWDDKCAYCKTTSDVWHKDHFMPLELKGHEAEYNYVLACPPCNQSKGAKHPQVWLDEMKISFIYPDYMLNRDKTLPQS